MASKGSDYAQAELSICWSLITQLMHSFEVDIRICQPENRDVRRGEHHFRGLSNPDVNRKRMHQLFCYLFLVLFKIFSYL